MSDSKITALGRREGLNVGKKGTTQWRIRDDLHLYGHIRGNKGTSTYTDVKLKAQLVKPGDGTSSDGDLPPLANYFTAALIRDENKQLNPRYSSSHQWRKIQYLNNLFLNFNIWKQKVTRPFQETTFGV